MTKIHRLSERTILAVENKTARYIQMGVYRSKNPVRMRADAPYFPHRMDALGLYRFAGTLANTQGNPLDGFYAVDDFGQLVRVPIEAALASYH